MNHFASFVDGVRGRTIQKLPTVERQGCGRRPTRSENPEEPLRLNQGEHAESQYMLTTIQEHNTVCGIKMEKTADPLSKDGAQGSRANTVLGWI